jgi:hypothetical protein
MMGPIRLGVLAVALFTAFRYLADFSVRQSTALAVVGCLAYIAWAPLQTLFAYSGCYFPFFVHVYPKWDFLLPDFGLVKTDDELRRFCESVRKLNEEAEGGSEPRYSVAREGIRFTFLTWNKIGRRETALIYYDNRRTFLTRIDLWEIISEIEIADERPEPRYPAPSSPVLYVETNPAGFELGIKSPPWMGNVPVATIPYGEFDLYMQQESGSFWDQMFYIRSVDRKMAAEREIKSEREKLRAEFGWKGGESVIEHKYFTVAHGRI